MSNNTCEFKISNTNEPKIVYRDTSGSLHFDYKSVLKNSTNTFEFGYMNADNQFESMGTAPVYLITTVEGSIQTAIANGLLETNIDNPNEFVATTKDNADVVEAHLVANHPLEYQRKGNVFTISKQKDDISGKSFSEVKNKFGILTALQNEAVKTYKKLSTQPKKPLDTTHSKENLYLLLKKFMSNMGISEMSIQDYEAKYKVKFGIEPDAKALIDINEKVVALTQGEATLSDLSEEVAHFIIEALPQADISRMLEYVPNTTYYKTLQDKYRTIYSKQVSGEALEQAVRKEILGKMLNEAFQKEFDITTKTEVEQNFFRKLLELLKEFVGFVSTKVTKESQDELQLYVEDIAKHFHNETLELENTSPTTEVQVMYSISKEAQKEMDRLNVTMDSLLKGTNNQQLKSAVMESFNFVNSQFNIVSDLFDKLSKIPDDEVTPYTLEFEIMEMVDNIELYTDWKNINQELFKAAGEEYTPLKQTTDKLIIKTHDLKSLLDKKSKKDTHTILQDMWENLGLNADSIKRGTESIMAGVNKIRKDTSNFNRMFMHKGKAKDEHVSTLTAWATAMRSTAISNVKKDTDNFATKLIKFKNKLVDFIDGIYFRNGYDTKRIEQDKLQYRYDILVKIGEPNAVNNSFEEYSKDPDLQTIPEDKKNVYDYFYKKDYANQKWANKNLANYYTNFIEKLEKLFPEEIDGFQNGTSEIYNTLLHYSELRKKSGNQAVKEMRQRDKSVIGSDLDIRKGLKVIPLGQAKAQGHTTYLPLYNYSQTLKDSDLVVILRTKDEILTAHGAFLSGLPAHTGIDETVDNIYREAKRSYNLIKFDNETFSKDDLKEDIHNNFKQAYLAYKEKIKADPNKDRLLHQWVRENLHFNISEEYYANSTSPTLNIEELRKQNVADSQEADTIHRQLVQLRLIKSEILKKYKNVQDIREILADRLSSRDKLKLENLEEEISEHNRKLNSLFAKYKLDTYKDAQGEPWVSNINEAFYNEYKQENGRHFQDLKVEDKITTLKKYIASNKLVQYEKFSKLLTKAPSALTNQEAEYIKKYRDKTVSANPNDIRVAFLEEALPSWYKRFDISDDQEVFFRNLKNNNLINLEEMIDEFLDNPEVDFRGIQYLKATPSFKYASDFEESLDDLYEQYQSSTDSKEKKELLEKMAGMHNIKDHNHYRDSKQVIKDDELETYIAIMDYHLHNLHTQDSLKSYNIFLRPQMRKSTLERYESFIKEGNKGSQIVDALREAFQYREDDLEDVHLHKKGFPKYGMMRLTPEELTNDVLASLVWQNDHARLWEQRTIYYPKAELLRQNFLTKTFKGGKKAIDSNYYKIIQDTIDTDFFGKTVTAKWELNILGNKIDMAKFMLWFKNMGIVQALGFSPIVATTNFISGLTQEQIIRWTNRDIYGKSNQRANMMLAPMLAESIKDISELQPATRINNLMIGLGVHDGSKRFEDSKYNKTFRIMPELPFSLMAITNFPLQAKVMLSKLMEVRLINGEFYTWRQYLMQQKALDPKKTQEQIAASFDLYKDKSAYDMMDDSGNFNVELLEKEGYKKDPSKVKNLIMAQIRDISEQVTMELYSTHSPIATKDPAWSFVLALKKWMIIANSAMFSDKRFNVYTGTYDEGMIMGFKNISTIIKQLRKDNSTILEAWETLSEEEQKSTKQLGITLSIMVMMMGLATLLKGYADDDEEKDNYLAQFAAYLAMRNLNETFSGNIGVGNAYYEAIRNPITTAEMLKNTVKIFDIRDIGTEVQQGKYKGLDKHTSSIIKATWLKNLYSVKDAEVLNQTRGAYKHFNQKDALYHVFSFIEDKKEKDE